MSKYLKEFENHTQYENYINGNGAILPNVSICTTEGDVHYNPYVDPYNGHAYVDLGLSVKWATMNVGATSETDYGLYFQWGDASGYTADQVGVGEGQKSFTWRDYKFNPNGDGSTMTKYNATDGKTKLDASDDAAHVNMGGSWRMPTEEELQELIDRTTSAWTTNYNGSKITGVLLTSKANNNTLFFPAAGYCYDNSTWNVGSVSVGHYCGSYLSTSSVIFGRSFGFNISIIETYDSKRCLGFPVRGVIG